MNNGNKISFVKSICSDMRLGEIVTEIKAGFACGSSELKNGDIAHLRPMNIDEDCRLAFEGTRYISKEFFKDKKNYKLKAGDILFNNTNSTELVGKSCYITHDIYCGFSNHMTRIRVNESLVDSYFLSNLFYAMWKQRIFESHCHKWVNQAGINMAILSNIVVSIPPLVEQQKIADLFQSINNSIEQAEQQEKNLRVLSKRLIDGLIGREPTFGSVLEQELIRVKFADVADCIEQHKKETLPFGLNRFVGLENIEPENFRILSWGNVADGTTFTKTFAKGDVLFGKRRPYLKKVAIAEFDGICSGDVLVFRAKENKMLAELLPFYAASETFIQYAVNTSAGSLSPRTKWKDLAKFAFSIPDLETQTKILEVLQQIQNTSEQIIEQKQTLRNLKLKVLNEILG